MLGFVVSLLHLSDLGQQRFFIRAEAVIQFFQLMASFDHLGQKRFRLLPLDLQLRIGIVQFVPGQLQIRLLCFQFFPGGSDILRSQTKFFQTALIRRGDLPDHVQPVQQVGKALGLEQHFPVREGSLFFHGTDTVLVLCPQFLMHLFRQVQFVLLIRDQKIEGGDLLVDVGDFSVQQADLLIDQVFPADDVLYLTLCFLKLGLQVLHLLPDLSLLFFQLIDLVSDLGGRGSRCVGGNVQQQAQQHGRCQHKCQ